MFFRYSVSEDVQDWIYDNFLFAIRTRLLTPKTPLVLATKQFFKTPKGEDDVVVASLVKDIQRLLGRSEKDIKVSALNVLDDEFRHEYGQTSNVAGTWQDDGEQSVISYDPNLVKSPIALVSMLTHEVMHEVLHSIADYPPGGPEAEELNTDLHCITTGFGVLQITHAQTMGWAGYMRQNSRIHALAMFVLVRDLPQDQVLAVLPQANKRQFKKAMNVINQGPDRLAELRERLNQARPVIKK
jgi:hypothetical protein